MNNENRRIGDYNVLTSIKIGDHEIALCENEKASKDEVYLCEYIENNGIYERLTDCMVSDSYADIAVVFGERITEKAKEVQYLLDDISKEIGDDIELKKDDCLPVSFEDCIKDHVVVLRGDSLRPEYRRISSQLLLCTGGFGAQGNARGRTCFATSLYDGEKTLCLRGDILGILPEDKLPDWAKAKLNEIRQSEAVKKDTRGDR